MYEYSPLNVTAPTATDEPEKPATPLIVEATEGLIDVTAARAPLTSSDSVAVAAAAPSPSVAVSVASPAAVAPAASTCAASH